MTINFKQIFLSLILGFSNAIDPAPKRKGQEGVSDAPSGSIVYESAMMTLDEKISHFLSWLRGHLNIDENTIIDLDVELDQAIMNILHTEWSTLINTSEEFQNIQKGLKESMDRIKDSGKSDAEKQADGQSKLKEVQDKLQALKKKLPILFGVDKIIKSQFMFKYGVSVRFIPSEDGFLSQNKYLFSDKIFRYAKKIADRCAKDSDHEIRAYFFRESDKFFNAVQENTRMVLVSIFHNAFKPLAQAEIALANVTYRSRKEKK